MLIVTGVIEIAAGGVELARAAAVDMVAETLNEPGCILYEFSQVLGQETRFRVYEEWQDLAALEAHFATPHMGRFRAALAKAGVVSREVYRREGGDKVLL
ncbi:putative quinol monooxygenase [Ruegeria aquimaris]|uniref:Antibiotic biosynthesis monooxygenase n=1 Tax=Ruegeria aquimaris TaxID=2984333 RepID=A0ABT3APA8_9RHOB|nr:putative quinol monooxygenase [Ruegeria sp. XHP0148]MCV2889936.1 antibiotic biosynthesis monooxygenase [Ruegeria sp. XHP0148]